MSQGICTWVTKFDSMHIFKPNPTEFLLLWTSYQIRNIAGCACARNAGNGFPATDFVGTTSQRTRHALWHVRDACAMMHVGIANPRWRGKRFQHSRLMHNPPFYISSKRPIENTTLGSDSQVFGFCIPLGLSYWQRLGQPALKFLGWVSTYIHINDHM